TTGVCTDLERQCRELEPFYGSTVDTIVVTGNTHTKTIAILREMATKQGAPLDERLIRRDSAYLRGLGYFAEVGISADTTEYGRCRVLVTVTERPAIFMRVPYPVVNYDFEKGLSYGATWKIKNFRGLAENLSASALIRQDKEEGASFSWNIPWLMGRRLGLRTDAFTYRRIELPSDSTEDWVKRQTGADLALSVPLTPSLVNQLWFRPGVSFDWRESMLLPSNGVGFIERGLYSQDFVSVGAQLVYDSRADRISPFNGMFHQVSVRRFTSVSGLKQQYVFYGFSDYFYIPTGTERVLIVAVDGDIREGDLPGYYEMKLGGVRDVRGFSDNDLRGPAKLVGTLQYRAQFFGPHVFRLPKIGEFDVTLNGVAFVDSGSIMNSILDLDTATFHTTGGFGVEIISPFRDLIRLEVASDGTGSPAFYMTSGANF
ncbi:MAG: BamA/TamA family outer membrane protein, partial [Candidatus Krumholzibacteriaceae bacterium]